jgi:hypothetical protein
VPATQLTSIGLAIAGTALVAACGGGDDDGVACDPAMGDTNVEVGTFEIELVAPSGDTPGYTSMVGVVHDGPSPGTLVWEEDQTAGDCRLVTPRVPFCATSCGSDAACVEDDVCLAYPAKQDVGTVHATGLGAAFDLEVRNGNYQPSGVTLAYPPFTEGGAVALESEGSAFACSFTLAGHGIAPLVVTTTEPALAAGTALDLAWTPPADGNAATVHVQLDISHHGGTKGKIECETADDGSLSIAASLVDGLLALGAAGYPTVILSRDATGSALVPAGRVDLAITAQVELPIDVPGVQSCTEDNECPQGQTCRDDLTCG